MDEEPKDKGGRPTSYSTEIAAEICVRLSAGESLRSICKDDHMPADSTVRAWAIANIEGFHAHYTRAREAQMDALAEDILEISDDKEADVQRSRLQVDTRKWLMSKIAPKRFGDRVAMQHTGANGGPIEYANLSEEEINARLAALIGSVVAASAGEKAGVSGPSGSESEEGG